MPSVTICSGGASKSKNAEALRLSTVTSVGASASTATGTWDDAPRSDFNGSAGLPNSHCEGHAPRHRRSDRIDYCIRQRVCPLRNSK
jgi:hypothetical protein